MTYQVYADPSGKSLLLVNENLWVINGEWQIEKKDGLFYCVAPHDYYPIDIHLVGYIDYDGDYNTTLDRFRNGEGTHLKKLDSIVKEIVQEIFPDPPKEPELCKRKYYGIECSCSKCKR